MMMTQVIIFSTDLKCGMISREQSKRTIFTYILAQMNKFRFNWTKKADRNKSNEMKVDDVINKFLKF